MTISIHQRELIERTLRQRFRCFRIEDWTEEMGKVVFTIEVGHMNEDERFESRSTREVTIAKDGQFLGDEEVSEA